MFVNILSCSERSMAIEYVKSGGREYGNHQEHRESVARQASGTRNQQGGKAGTGNESGRQEAGT
jgi:hypothetical protein